MQKLVSRARMTKANAGSLLRLLLIKTLAGPFLGALYLDIVQTVPLAEFRYARC